MKRIRNGLGSICPVGEKVLEIARMGNFWRIRNLLDVGYGGFHNKGFRRRAGKTGTRHDPLRPATR
jgi:hypothetical protein